MTAFLDLRRLEDKENHLCGEDLMRFDRSPSSFKALPTASFAYWAPPSLLKCFEQFPATEVRGIIARTGLSSNDDFRWLRLSWESEIGPHAVPFAKGGAFARYYADLSLRFLWFGDGEPIKVSKRERFRLGELTENNSKIWNQDCYFRPAVTWSARSQAGFSTRIMPKGSLFGHKGPALFSHTDSHTQLSALAAVSNSRTYRSLLRMHAAFGSFEVGSVRRTPIPDLEPSVSERLAGLARRGWSLRRSLDTRNEVSHAFVVPAVLQVEGDGFAGRVVAWGERVARVEWELEGVQVEIDELCFDLYGISEEDRRAIIEGFGVSDASDADADAGSDDEDELAGVDAVELGAGLVSWCVEVATGRFDVRLGTGEWGWPSEPDPFDPLPVCSPGMLTGDDGLPLSEPPDGYPVGVSPVLVVDPGHRLDVSARVREVFDVVFGDEADGWWTGVGEVLDRRGEVGSWLSKGFFDHHLKTYSKSRRKAPVIWPIGTGSGSYQVWLYAHRMTGDSLFRVLNDLIVPKLNTEEAKLTRLRQEAGPNPSASERKTIDAQEKLVGELVELREMVEGLAPLWAPDLNDGIVIVLAPFWRLFSHHKPWMRELKKHWQKLAKGDYDWAQLAMHLWPERVIPKCVEDRSLAIAHNLEDVFWQPDPDNEDKWIARDTPTTPIDQLITDRHNPTAKTALATMDTK